MSEDRIAIESLTIPQLIECLRENSASHAGYEPMTAELIRRAADRLEAAEAEIARLVTACKPVESWWLSEGMYLSCLFDGANQFEMFREVLASIKNREGA